MNNTNNETKKIRSLTSDEITKIMDQVSCDLTFDKTLSTEDIEDKVDNAYENLVEYRNDDELQLFDLDKETYNKYKEYLKNFIVEPFEIKSFKELVRFNTGTHMMDSGGENNRHWQNELPQDGVEVIVNEDGIEATISLHSLLEANLNIDHELNNIIGKQYCLEDVAEKLYDYGFNINMNDELNLDNTYNYNNELSQDFQFVVLSEEMILIQTHNGADIRDDYSPVCVCRFKEDDSQYNLFELLVKWNVLEVFDYNTNKKLNDDEMLEIEDQINESNHATYILDEMTKKATYNQEDKTISIETKDNKKIIVDVYHNCL